MNYSQPWDILKTAIIGNQAHAPTPCGAGQPGVIFAQATANGGQLALNAAGLPSDLLWDQREPDLLQYPVDLGRTLQTFGKLFPGDNRDTQFTRAMSGNEGVGRTPPPFAPFVNVIKPEGGVREHGWRRALLGFALSHSAQSLDVDSVKNRIVQAFKVSFQIANRANGLRHNPEDHLAEAFFLGPLVGLQDRVGFVAEVCWLSHIYIYSISKGYRWANQKQSF